MNPFGWSLLLSALTLAAAEPLVIIVHPTCTLQAMTRDEAAALFLGRRRRLSSGEVALPAEALLPEEQRRRFYYDLTGLSLTAVRARWAQVYFSGQGQPPGQVADGPAMIEWVATHRGAVGFVAQSQITPRVRGVLFLSDAGP